MQAIARFLNEHCPIPQVQSLEDCENLDSPAFRYKTAFAAGRHSVVQLLIGQLNSMKPDRGK